MDGEREEGGYELVLSFPDQSHSFAHGFEAGKLWERLATAQKIGAEVIDTRYGFPIHAENEELVMQMAAHFGFRAIISGVSDGTDTDYSEWTNVRFERVA